MKHLIFWFLVFGLNFLQVWIRHDINLYPKSILATIVCGSAIAAIVSIFFKWEFRFELDYRGWIK